MTPLKKSVIFS